MSLLEINGLTHAFGDNLLYKNAELTLNKGEHIPDFLSAIWISTRRWITV